MAAQFKTVTGGSLLQQCLNVAAKQVLGGSAFNAQQVVVVSPVAQLVLEVSVLQQHPADHARFHQ